jgi:single-stranded-DNA-specific exonuclease
LLTPRDRAPWIVAPRIGADEQRELGADSLLLTQLLWNRGVRSDVEAHAYLFPLAGDHLGDPLSMHGLPSASERLLKAIGAGERIAIYGDYDVDGVAGSALLTAALRGLGADLVVHLPDRARDGYGVHPEAVRQLVADGARVMVTVDCGISANHEVQLARSLGLDVIVADHHALPGILPSAFAVLNPHQESCRYPCKDLAGGGVAYQLARAVLGAALESGEADRRARHLATYAALSTVADVVPLTGENRGIVAQGLASLRSGGPLGLRALAESAGRDLQMVTAIDLAFRIIPRLNAAGRMGNAREALDLLLAEDWATAQAIAVRLEEANVARRLRVDELLVELEAEAAEACGQGAIVLFGDYPIGVAGLIATRFAERFGVPCAVIERGNATSRGSVRGIDGIDLVSVLGACSEHLVQYGGHERAAGFTVPSDEVPLFKVAFERGVRATGVAPQRPAVAIDGILRLSSVGPRLADLVELFEPTGAGNPRPLFLSRGALVRSVGQLRGGHLRLTLAQDWATRRAVAFRPTFSAPRPGARVDVVYEVERSVWNGVERVDMIVRDVREGHAGEVFMAPAV